jgi:O-antigen ligase
MKGPAAIWARIETEYRRLSAPVARLLAVALALAVWAAPSRLSHFLAAIGLFAVALARRPRGSPAWRNVAGLACIGFVAYLLLGIPFSASPVLSLRSFVKFLPAFGIAFAIPVLFGDRRKLESAMLVSATALTLVLGLDLLRLYDSLGGQLVDMARFTRPYVLNHPNVASMLAAAAALVLGTLAWRRPVRGVAFWLCLAGAGVNLAYLVALASRGPQLAFAVAAASFGAFFPDRRRRIAWLVGLGTLAVVAALNLERVNPRFGEPDVATFNERNVVWSHTWKLTQQHPVFGHGFGKKVFREVYYASNPPPASFDFPHCHSYWLMVLFESGWVGVAVNAGAWALLVGRLWRSLRAWPDLRDRLPAGTVLMLITLVLVYSVPDYPDHLVRNLEIWLIPAALVLAHKTGEPGPA